MSHPRTRCAIASLVLTLLAAAPALVRGDVPPAAPADSSSPPSFRQDVLPVLTRFGCNSGGCHGKLAGQNGFKLSLRGYAPAMDFEPLATDLTPRRSAP